MSEHNTSRAIRYLPQVAVATTAVAVLPIVIVWWLRDQGTISSPWVCIGLAVALSLAASIVGNAVWQRRRGSDDVFFSEILLWGWVHRLRAEHRLAKTAGLLGLGELGQDLIGLAPTDGLERTARLLREMAAALDSQDPYTDGHSRRVALHCAMVGRKMGLEREEIAKVRTAAAVHDIGKLRIPPELLNKPGELSEEEFEVVKRHADEGAQIVSCMEDPEITGMVRHHHERFDGAGYPSGLIGEDIPLGARIIAVADTFDALTSVRPYRNAIPHKRALEAITAVSGTQLDPAVVRAFLRCYSANRAVLFWTLLAVSPQRALAWIRGKAPGQGNLASAAASVAVPAALATVVAAAFGSGSGLAPSRPPLRLAQRTPVQASAKPQRAQRHSSHRSSSGISSRTVKAATSAPKQSVLGTRVTRGASSKRSVKGSGGGGSGAGAGGGTSAGGGSGGGHGTTPGHPPTNGGGVTATSPATFTPPPSGSGPPLAVSLPTTTVSAPATPTTPATSGSGPTGPAGGSTGADPGGGTGSPSGGGSGAGGSVGGSQGSSGGTQGGSGGTQGGSGGTQGGSGGTQGGSGGNQGGSTGNQGGSGNGGPGEPLTKDDCKNGGWAHFDFPNQGLCVSFVEAKLHH